MKKIFIDKSSDLTRVAITEDGQLSELYFEQTDNKTLVGNIYQARVEKVVFGINCAFMDIGEAKNAILYFDKTVTAKNLKQGDHITVQIIKDPTGEKGATATLNLSFQGRYCVVLPNQKYISISSKIEDKEERQRLKEIVEEIATENVGVIVRTNSNGKNKMEILKEVEYLVEKSKTITEQAKYNKAPVLLYEEVNVMTKVMRDFLTADVEKLVINDKKAYDDTMAFISLFKTYEKEKIFFYNENIPIFDNYFIESQIDKALQKKVWLKNGGFLVIEETEACVVIDVNSGKFTGKKEFDKTILATNVEAAYEVAKQIKLRNLSGMIIIDFISMKHEEDKQKIKSILEVETKKDRVTTLVIGMTELGLMQITRKKTSEPISKILYDDCRSCGGNGKTLNVAYISNKIRNNVVTIFAQTSFSEVTVGANEKVIKHFRGKDDKFIIELENKYNKKININKLNCGNEYYSIDKK